MRVTFILPGPLHALAGGREEVAVDAPAPRVVDALTANEMRPLVEKWPLVGFTQATAVTPR